MEIPTSGTCQQIAGEGPFRRLGSEPGAHDPIGQSSMLTADVERTR